MSDPTPTPPGPSPLEQLLAVQDLDTALARLQHRRATLPEREHLESTQAELRSIDVAGTEVGARRRDLVEREAELERQIGTLNQRRQAVEARLYGARGSAARDLTAMDDEVRHLGERRAELEEIELGLMEEQEPLDHELGALAARRQSTAARLDALAAELADAETVLDEEITALGAERAAAAERLPADLASRYESLRQHLGGTGAARLVGNRCEGCHLELPAVEVDRIRHLGPDELVTCDQCGRILVRSAPPGSG